MTVVVLSQAVVIS